MLLSFSEVAMICHEQNRAYHEALGDKASSQELLPWSQLDFHVQQAIEEKVRKTAQEDPDLLTIEPSTTEERVQLVLYLRMIQTCMEIQG